MESVFVLKRHELTSEFLENIKSLFKGQDEFQITISPTQDFGLNKFETKKEYFHRLEKAAENLENNHNSVSMTENELDEFVENILKQ